MSKTTSQILADNLKYYTNDVTKRCVEGGSCNYWGGSLNLNTDGCFVGRLMTEEQRKKVDEFNGACDSDFESVLDDEYNIFGHGNEFSDLLRNNVKIMMRFQQLHDCKRFWNDKKGLSEKGQFELKKILSEFPNELNEKDFKEFLV